MALMLLGLLLLGLSACAGSGAQPAVDLMLQAEVDADIRRHSEALARKQQLRKWLANAQQALANDRLKIPRSDNAYDWYQQVLAVDELNAEAHWGMEQISQRYMQLAEQAFKLGRVDRAEQMLWGAAQISATQQQLEDLRGRYRQVAANDVYLSTEELSARNESIQRTLAEIALQAQEKGSRLLIVARNDAEGRWIYKQMRGAVDGYRLRGNIKVGKVPRVRLIDL